MIKNPPASAGDPRDAGWIPWWGRSLPGGNGNLLQYSCLENPMDRGARWATVHGVTKNRTCMSMYKDTQTHTQTHAPTHHHEACYYVSECSMLSGNILSSESGDTFHPNMNLSYRNQCKSWRIHCPCCGMVNVSKEHNAIAKRMIQLSSWCGK